MLHLVGEVRVLVGTGSRRAVITRCWLARLLSWLSFTLQMNRVIGMRSPTVPLASWAPHSGSRN